MHLTPFENPAAWTVDAIAADKSWRFRLNEDAAQHLATTIKKQFDPDRDLFDYRRDDFDLGPALDVIVAATRVAHSGCGIAVVKGLPREHLNESEFRLLN